MSGIADLLKGDQEPSEDPAELGVGKPETDEGKAETASKESDLGTDADEGGRPVVPVKALTKERVKRQDAERRAALLEKELEEARKATGGTSEAIEKVYGGFQDPIAQMQMEADFAQAWWEKRDDPAVVEALKVIQAHHQGRVRVPNRETEAKPATEPAGDPRVEALLRKSLADETDRLLEEAKVRRELRGPIREHVLSKNPNPSREDVLTSMQEYVNGQGWTKEFLRGSGKSAPTPLPNPAGLAAGVSRKKDENGQIQTQPPQNIGGIERSNRSKLHDLMKQKGL